MLIYTIYDKSSLIIAYWEAHRCFSDIWGSIEY